MYIRQGSTQKVELEGDPEVLKKIETEVSGDRLSVGTEEKWFNWNWSDSEKITVYITMKDVEGIYLSGSGDIVTEVLKTGDVELKVSGSGNLKAEINSSGVMEADISGSGGIYLKGSCAQYDSDVSGSGRADVTLTVSGEASFGISGSGKIQAQGSANRVKTSISGSGRLMAAEFATKVCEVRISGSGDVQINVKDELDANISGSGSVSYKGDPAKVNSHSSGSGKVKKIG
jgi:hypothetical protein